MKKPKYYVHYVKDSTPLLKEFKTLKAAEKFVTKFQSKGPSAEQGYWVDFIIVGDFIPVDNYYSEIT